jgi:hypothetical protein
LLSIGFYWFRKAALQRGVNLLILSLDRSERLDKVSDPPPLGSFGGAGKVSDEVAKSAFFIVLSFPASANALPIYGEAFNETRVVEALVAGWQWLGWI